MHTAGCPTLWLISHLTEKHVYALPPPPRSSSPHKPTSMKVGRKKKWADLGPKKKKIFNQSMTAGLPSHHESRFLTPPSPWRPWCSAIFICWLQPVVASAPLFCLLREGKGKLQVYYNCMNVQFPPLAPTKSWRMFWFRRGGTTESDPPTPTKKPPTPSVSKRTHGRMKSVPGLATLCAGGGPPLHSYASSRVTAWMQLIQSEDTVKGWAWSMHSPQEPTTGFYNRETQIHRLTCKLQSVPITLKLQYNNHKKNK